MLDRDFLRQIEAAGHDHAVIVGSFCRNERRRLPSWLNHYRKAGITCFAVVDNGSDDGSYEYLAEQDDVILTRTADSYSEANYGVAWINTMLDTLTTRCWLLYADADEQLIYRGWPETPIADLVTRAEGESANAIFGFMMDMYPDGPMEGGEASDEHDLSRAAPCFDRDYHFRIRPRKPWAKADGWVEVIGGPRVRLMSSLGKEKNSGWSTYWLRGQSDRWIPKVPRKYLPAVLRLLPTQMPVLSKYPLVRANSGAKYIHAHLLEGGKIYSDSTVLLHFKMLSDFAHRVHREVERGEHYHGGIEYIQYADILDRNAGLDLRYDNSGRFEGAGQLIELGFIRDLSPFGPYPL